PDTTAPTVSVTAPANGATVSGTAVAVSATASDDVGVVGVQFKLDGANWGAEDAAGPYTKTWDTTTAADGTHTVSVVARDAAGNTTTSAVVTVTVSNTAPPPAGVTIWPASAVPGGINTADTQAVELGVRFRTDANGTITALRFYKG